MYPRAGISGADADMRTKKADIVVVGAGIQGLLTARELARGGLSVMLIERNFPGREASRASAGILSPLYPWRVPAPMQALAHWSQQYYPVLADDLRRETGIDPEFINSGMLIFGAEEQQVAQAWARYSARPLDILEGRQITVCEPGLAGTQMKSAVYLPTVAHVQSSRLLKALTEHIYGLGVPILNEQPVTGLLERNGEITGLRTPGGDIEAGRVVLATGAWSGELLESEGLAGYGVRPVRGQIIQFDGPPGLLTRILLDDGKYIVSRRNGHLVVGATIEDVGFDDGVTDDARDMLQEAAARILPALGNLPVQRQWAGLRPGTDADCPLIGEHPEMRGLYLNTGHSRHGLTTAPASARLLADLLLERSPILDPGEYRVGR
jgi:glycine oxidase